MSTLSLKVFAKRSLFRVSPRLAAAIVSARARAHSHRVVASWGGRRVAHVLVDRFGPRVQSGFFEGLVLTPMTLAEQIGPYLLGVYESELDEAWAVIVRGTYTRIVDVGAKFGYYAVGLARRFPEASVTAFDTDWWARKATREMAAANATGNVAVKGYCDRVRLLDAAGDSGFILCDCDGYEAELFAAPTIASLGSATCLIETHDSIVPGITARLRSAFADTHVVRVYGSSQARRAPTTGLDFLSESERGLAVHEVRPPQCWLLCLPRTGVNRGLGLDVPHTDFT